MCRGLPRWCLLVSTLWGFGLGCAQDEDTGAKVKFEGVLDLVVDVSVQEVLVDFLYGEDSY